MKNRFTLLIVAAALTFLTACSDPSSSVTKATTTTETNTAAAPSASAAAAAKEFVVLPDSKIEFVGSKVTGSHTGGFTNFQGKVNIVDGKISGSPQLVIDMHSTWSDNSRLTGHLKSADFFEVEKFPTSTFTVTSIEGEGDEVKVNGNLDLHGVTRGISFPAKVKITDDLMTVQADFAINRKDFGIVYSGKTDDLIRDNVVIRFDLKAAPAKG